MICVRKDGAAGTNVPIHQYPEGGVDGAAAAEAKHQSDSG